MTARLVLGTAQFGLEYGIVNAKGRVPPDEVCSILDLARNAGVDAIDTAVAYGDAEDVLGRCGVAGLQVISKVPEMQAEDGTQARAEVMESARRSVAKLRCERLYGLLLHAAADLTGPHGADVYAGLLAARDAGLTERIGVSVYDAEDMAVVLDRYRFDLIQLPLSVLDQRLTDWIPRMKDRGIAPYVRSVFLQGVLLCPAGNIPEALRPLAPWVEAFHDRARSGGSTPLDAALAFVRDLPGIEGIVVGTTHIDEFRSVIASFANAACFDAAGLGVADADLIDPRSWAPA